MVQNLRWALRPLYRGPGPSVVIVLTVALGVGLTSAMFAIVDGVLLRPLPYRNPSRLVTLRAVPTSTIDGWASRTRALSDVASFDFALPPLLLAGEEATRLRQAAVSPNLLGTLGVVPALGRAFSSADAESGAEPVAILTHGAWQDHFGGRASAVGELAPTEPVSLRIVGVLPASFIFPTRPSAAVGDVRILTVIPRARGVAGTPDVVGRLAVGATLSQVRAEEMAIVHPRRAGEPRVPETIALTNAIVGNHRFPLLLLFGAVGLLLLMACANVSHLVFATAMDSGRELAVRLALGASRFEVVRLVLLRSCVLCLTGGALGALLAYLSIDAIMTVAPVALPRISAVGIDIRVVAFAMLLSVAIGVAVGLVPAWHLATTDPHRALRHDSRTASSSQRLRHAALAVEVALAVTLLAGAGLAANSFWRLLRVDPGFHPDGVLTFRTRGPESRYPTVEHQRELLEQTFQRLGAMPGVEHVGAVDALPVTRAVAGGSIVVLDRPDTTPLDAEPRTIAGEYFAALRIDVVHGRALNRRDIRAGQQAAIVNEALARRVSQDADVIGRRVRHRNVEREIVGVVRDVRAFAINTAPEPMIYIPHTQASAVPAQIVVRTSGPPEMLAPHVRRELRALEPRAPIENVRPLSAHVAASIAQPRFQTAILATLGAAGLLLVAVGIGGMVSYTVSRRTREIGIRIALGAGPRKIAGTVAGPTLIAVGVGLAAGFIAALGLGRIFRSLVYEIDPHDPATLAVITLALAAIAIAASALPARRALRVDPIVTLRAE